VNTDVENKAVSKFLIALVETQKSFRELSRQLKLHAETKTVEVIPFSPEKIKQHHWDETQQTVAYGSEFGVSAMLQDETTIDWWLDVRVDGSGWCISANVLRSDPGEEGCHKVAEFGDQHSLDLEEAIKRLSEAVDWLGSFEIPF